MTSIQKYDAPYTECPICKDTNIYQYHQDFRGNSIYRCKKCTAQFMNPVYSDAYLNDYYANYYSGGPDNTPGAEEDQLRTNKMKFRFFDKLIKQPGKVLDFGCGNGNFMAYAMEKGWQVTGYDVDCDAMGQVAQRMKVPVRCGPLEQVDWVGEKFDLIQTHHVVEHLKQPVRDLSILRDLLLPGGYLYIGVPNIHAFSARAKLFFEKLGLKRSNVGKYYDSDHHVFYYTPRSLRCLLESLGFEIVLSMNGAKADISDNRLVQFLTYYLPNYVYSNSAFFVIARKREDR